MNDPQYPQAPYPQPQYVQDPAGQYWIAPQPQPPQQYAVPSGAPFYPTYPMPPAGAVPMAYPYPAGQTTNPAPMSTAMKVLIAVIIAGVVYFVWQMYTESPEKRHKAIAKHRGAHANRRAAYAATASRLA